MKIFNTRIGRSKTAPVGPSHLIRVLEFPSLPMASLWHLAFGFWLLAFGFWLLDFVAKGDH
ncbi:hypothetical protein BJX62DRAFT_205762 [Aspergillus germanicus]